MDDFAERERNIPLDVPRTEPFNCHHPLWDSRDSSDSRGEEVFDWVISSHLLPLNDPKIPTLLYRSSGSRSSSDISFDPSSFALSCSWEVLLYLGSEHLPHPSLSLVFRPNERPPSLNFQKARRDDFASYFDSLCLSGIECSQIFHSFRPHQTPS